METKLVTFLTGSASHIVRPKYRIRAARQKHRARRGCCTLGTAVPRRHRFPFVHFLFLLVSLPRRTRRQQPFPSRFGAYPLGATDEILLAWKELSGISSGRRAICPLPPVAAGEMFPRSIIARTSYSQNLLLGGRSINEKFSTLSVNFVNVIHLAYIYDYSKKGESALLYTEKQIVPPADFWLLSKRNTPTTIIMAPSTV